MGKRHLLPLEAGRVRLRLLESTTCRGRWPGAIRTTFAAGFLIANCSRAEQHADWFARYQQRDDDFVFVIEELHKSSPLRRERGRGRG